MTAVAQVINSFSNGGAELLACRIAEALASRYQSHVVALSSSDATVERSIVERLNAQGVVTHNINRHPSRDFVKGVLRCREYIKDNCLEIVHTHCESPDAIGRLASIGLRTKVISTLHNHFPYPGRRALGWLVERCLRFKTELLIECSPGMEGVRRYLGRGPDEVLCNYNGIDPERFKLDPVAARRRWNGRLGLPDTARLIVSVGRIAKQKGHDVLVQSFAHIYDQHPHVYLAIAGGGRTEPDFYRHVRSLANRLLGKRALFLGETGEAPSLMAAAAVIVMPSRWEGLSLAFLEALATGRPFIATKIVPHTSILTGDLQADLVAPEDIDALAERLNAALLYPDRFIQRSALRRKLVEEEYNESRMLENYAAVYQELMHARWSLRWDGNRA